MELTNEIYACEPLDDGVRAEVQKEVLELLTLMLAPMTPHIAEEMWEMLGHSSTLGAARWPEYVPKLAEEEQVEKDTWYWTFVTEAGKAVTKKMTTEQIRQLVKAGHLDPKAQLSKTEKSGYRAAATFPEFQAIFKSLKTNTKANVKGAKYRDKYKEIEEEDARRRKYGWLSRLFKSFGSTLFGLLWIALILALVGGVGFLIYKYMN